MLVPDEIADDQLRLEAEKSFASAVELLKKLLHLREVEEIFDPDVRPHARMVYTQGVTIWMLILQRLGKGHSLSEVVTEIIRHDRDMLPDNKRVREGTLSENPSGYSRARQRLPLELIENFSHLVCDYLGRLGPKLIDDRRVFAIDGTTITLPPTPELQDAFPPATNGHHESVWPVARLLVANELQSGCALLPQIDPMYGPNSRGETAQAREIVQRLPARSIVLADSGFGIYSVAYHSQQAGLRFLFRLTTQRFKAYYKKATLIETGKGYKSYQLKWTPSPKDLKKNPDLPADACLEVVLHQVSLEDDKSLYLVSSLSIDAQSTAALYKRRYDVEFDIRDLKVTMDAENIASRSVKMVKKELFTSVIAYNLVAQFRRQAAQLAKIEPRRLSFTGVWISFRYHLLLQTPTCLSQWIRDYDQALISASKRKLPNRKSPRSCPRKAHTRRQKSTKFQKEQQQKNKIKPPDM